MGFIKNRQIIKEKYFSAQKQKKTYEQLEIGKIKFEVQSVYLNSTYITSLFQIRYTPSAAINSYKPTTTRTATIILVST